MDVYRAKARKIGVTIKQSSRAGKKFDVYKNDEYQASIGDKGYQDYEKYKNQLGKSEADKKRKAYLARHADNIKVKMRDGKLTAGYLAAKILW